MNLAVFVLSLSSLAIGQSINVKVVTSKSKCANNQVLEATIFVENTSSTPFKGNMEIETPFLILSKNNFPIDIPAHKKNCFTTVIFINKHFLSEKNYPIQVKVQDQNKTIVRNETVNISIIKERMVYFTVLEQKTVIENNKEMVQILLHFVNQGNTNEKVKALAKLPSGKGMDLIEMVSLNLPAFSDTTVIYSFVKKNELKLQENQLLNITGVYEDGQIFGINTIEIQSYEPQRGFRKINKRDLRFNNRSEGLVKIPTTNIFPSYKTNRFSLKDQINMNFDIPISFHVKTKH